MRLQRGYLESQMIRTLVLDLAGSSGRVVGTVLRFGVFELDIESEQLLKNGLAIRLKPQPFKLLKLLVNEAGRVVTREEIRAALWTGDRGLGASGRLFRCAATVNPQTPLWQAKNPPRSFKKNCSTKAENLATKSTGCACPTGPKASGNACVTPAVP